MCLDINTIKKFYIFGYGKLGQYLKTFLQENTKATFEGFIDNNANESEILKPQNIKDKNITVFVASINYMYEMTMQLKELNFTNIITFAELTAVYKELQSYNQAYLGLTEDYQNNVEKYDKLKNILSDDKSKMVLDAIIHYRNTMNIDIYHKISEDINNQYFEDFMPKDCNVFIDGGAFDGDTVLRAINHNFNFDKIYFFEPDEVSLNKAKENLKNMKGITFFPYGLSDKNKILKFDTRGNFGSCFAEYGNVEIKCVALDDIVKETKAFIKLDIEGAELETIDGAKKLIKNSSPFAVCVYHKPSDIWQIPEKILSINPEYKLYLRHYTNNIFETVLYGVPVND